MIIQRFNLNLIPNQSPVIVHVNQYDTGTGRLIATLYEGNEPYSPNGTAVIQGTKPDGHGFQYTATLDGNVVTADLTEQMSPVAGDVRAQIVVTESSGVTGTFVFIMRVQPSALPSDTDMSESDYQYIEEAIREAQEAVQTAQEATETAQEAVERAQEAIVETAENAENSEAWAQGTRGGIPVDPTDPTYEHNAEYWAQYAERYAQGGLHYKSSIPFADIPTTGMREGDMYNITDDFTTDSRFEEGAGIEVKGGTNIAWNRDNKWDVLALPPKTTFNGRSGSILPMAGDYDSEKILLTSVLHIGGETQENAQETLEALEGNKADKVDNAIADNFAGLDANGNLKDSGKNAGDFATPSDIAGQQSLLKDTVGWTGKNLLKNTATTRAINGVTFTVNADKSVTVNGTATANTDFHFNTPTSRPISELQNEMILSGLSEGANDAFELSVIYRTSADVYIRKDNVYGGQEKSLVIPQNASMYRACISVYSGITVNNITVYPMIRKADITDPTYEPYHESVEEEIEQIYADNGVLGAKNLIKCTAISQTISGITFTVNEDESVTVNGTPTITGNVYFRYGVADAKVGQILSGCPNGGGGSTYQLIAFNSSESGRLATDTGSSAIISREDSNARIGIYISTAVSNLTFKPMLRLASDPDDTYQPYAMTNRELTEKLATQDLSSQIQWETGYFSPITGSCKFIKYDGKYMFRLQGDIVQATGSNYIKIAKLPFTLPTFYGSCFPLWADRSKWVDMNIDVNGDVKIRTQSTATGTLIIQLVL